MVTVTPLPGKTFGARVTNVRLASLSPAEIAQLKAAFLKHGLLIFPDQKITPAEQAKFGRLFGRIEVIAPGMDAVPISNKKPDGTLLGEEEHARKILEGNEGWHSDSTYMPISAKASILCAHVVPPTGGGTGFADMRDAYAALPDSVKQKIGNLMAYHSLIYSQAKIGHQVEAGAGYGFYAGGKPLRPLVKVHPETGVPSLFIGRHGHAIPGLSEQESEKLMQELQEFAVSDERRTYEHEWSAGDVVMWDNRCTLHRAMPYPHTHERTLWHVRIQGERESEAAVNMNELVNVAQASL